MQAGGTDRRGCLRDGRPSAGRRMPLGRPDDGGLTDPEAPGCPHRGAENQERASRMDGQGSTPRGHRSEGHAVWPDAAPPQPAVGPAQLAATRSASTAASKVAQGAEVDGGQPLRDAVEPETVAAGQPQPDDGGRDQPAVPHRRRSTGSSAGFVEPGREPTCPSAGDHMNMSPIRLAPRRRRPWHFPIS